MATAHTFTNGDLFFTEVSNSRIYRKYAGETRTRVHWGDLKLMMADISFLTFFWDPEAVPKPIVVAAGAAPARHYPLLAKLFPDITFELYDPANFDIKETDRIHIHRELFTDSVAQKWSGRNDVFFTSDIRRTDYSKVEKEELEVSIREDMRMQESWVEIINPVFASLKFRLSYVDPDAQGNLVDIPMDFLDGFLMKQQWQPHASTESRLITVKVNSQLAKRSWSSLKQQEQAYWFNSIQREGFIFKSPFVEGVVDTSKELQSDYDSTATAVILKLYLEKMAGRPALQQEVANLFQLITDSINEHRKRPLTLEILRASSTKSSKNIFGKK